MKRADFIALLELPRGIRKDQKNRSMILASSRRMTAIAAVVLGVVLGLAASTQAFAQSVANYAPPNGALTRTTGITYSSIAGSSPSYFAWRNTASNQNDDNRSFQAPIGFDFWYLGVRYTQFSASLNGLIDLSASASDANTSPYAYGSPWQHQFYSDAGGQGSLLALAPLYADLWTQTYGTTPIASSLYYLTTGVAPNRVLTVEWLHFDGWNSPVNSTPADINMQVKIYEAKGVIEFVYGTMNIGTANTGGYYLRYASGINGSALGSPPTAAQLLAQQTDNTTTFSNGQQDQLTTLPASNSKLTFTPPVPATPTGLTFPVVGQTGMTLQWTDQATNELGFAIYNSTDNINFTYVTSVGPSAGTGGTVSAPINGLASATLYYWKVYAYSEGALSLELAGTQATNAGGTSTSHATGLWSAAATWAPDPIPGAGDNAIIADGTTVTLDMDGSCKTLTVGQGGSGQLVIGNDGTPRTLTVAGDVVVNTNAIMITGAAGPTHTMSVSGNLTNNGTLNLAFASVCNVTFNKNGNQTISGTGATTNFSRITLNMGTSSANVLEVTSTKFTVAVANFLTITNGTFKLSTPATVTPFTGNVSVPLSGGLWINNAGATVSTTGGSITLYGYVRATAGTLNIGNATDNSLTSSGGTLTIDGGTVNIAGRLDKVGVNLLTYFTMSSGTLTVATVGSTSGAMAPFNMDEVGSSFNMSGGTIIISRPGAGNLGYVNTGGTVGTVSGGTLQIGDGSTPAGQTILINASIPIQNLVVSNGVAVTAQLSTNSLTVHNNVTINSGTLNANALNITLAGNWTNLGGTFTPSTGTVTFNSTTAPQAINGTAVTQTFNNVTVNNSGQTLTPGGSTTTLMLNGTMTLTAGTLSAGTASAINVGGNWTNNGGTFTPGAGTVTFTGNAAAINGSTASQTFNNIIVSKTAGQLLSVSGSTTTLNLNGAFTETTGNFTAPATMAVTSAVTLTAGTFTAGTNVSVGGNWTNNGGTFTPGAGTVTFTGNAAAINGSVATQTFNNIIVNKTAGQLLSVSGSTTTLNVNGAFTETTGDFAAPATMAVTSAVTLTAGTFTAGTNVTVGENWTNNGGTFTPGAGTVTFTGNAAAINGSVAAQTFNNIIVNKTAAQTLSVGGSTATLTLNGNFTETTGNFTAPATLNIGGNVTLTAGTFTSGANSNVAGNWTNNGGTFTPGANTVTFNGGAAQSLNGTAVTQTFNNFTVNKGGGTLAVGGSTTTLTISGVVTLSAGTFAAGTATTINVAANWSNNSGAAAFTAGASNAIFNGSSAQVIGGSASTAFNNLILTNAMDTSAANYKTATAVLTVNGALTVNAGNTLDMQSFSGSTFGAGSTNSGKIRWFASNVYVAGTGTTEFYSPSAGNIAAGASYGNIHIRGTNKSIGAGVSVTATGGNAAFGVTIDGSLSVAGTGVLTITGMNLNVNGAITDNGTVTVQ